MKGNEEKATEWMSEQALFSRGEPKIYRGEFLTAIGLPVGGIGTGSIQIDGKAARPVWQIFNNYTQAFVPNSFFAMWVKTADGKTFLRALQTEPVGPFPAMKALSFRGEYPFGWFDFEDEELPVQVSMETFNPLVPMDVKSSAIPCAIYSFTFQNRSIKTVEVSILATQQNAVGYTGQGEIKGRLFEGYGGNINRIIRKGKATILHMAANIPKDAQGFGDMALVSLGGKATASASWESLETLANDFGDDGCLSGTEKAGPSPSGQTIDGALAASFKLKPKGKQTVTFILTWHFPNAKHGVGEWSGQGNMYSNWWDDALDVAREVIKRLPELTKLTRLYHDTLYSSNLPYWLLDRISSQVVVIRSPTCFWTKEGYFGGWEGCSPSSGCCHGNCNHVWQYAQAHARLFPEIGRIMREQEFRFQTPDGAIPHRQPNSHPAFDGQCGGILGAYREHLLSKDRKWLARHWESIKKAMDFTIATWDEDEDGVLSGAQWNTLDCNIGGSSSWLGTMFLASLAAAEKMAELEGDKESAERYRRIRQSGSKKQDETLFNGEYYIQIPDPKPQRDYLTGCHIDQVLGQWWAHQLNLGWLYPKENVQMALRSLFKYNFRTNFHGIKQEPRKFVSDDDPGMQMITWPKGGRPAEHTLYADEVMSGFEYSAAAMMVYAGLLKEGFTVVRAASIRYDGRLRTGLSSGDHTSWGHSGNPFCDDECGKFYARPMSIWSMLLACQGFICDSPAKLIGFKPIWKPEEHTTFFSASEAWGLFMQRRSGKKQTERIEVKYGKLGLREMVFELPEGGRKVKVTVRLGRQSIPATFTLRNCELKVKLRKEVTIYAGNSISVKASW